MKQNESADANVVVDVEQNWLDQVSNLNQNDHTFIIDK